jgi:hypothetical protein
VKILESRLVWGVLLIVGGVLFLLENLGVLPWGGLFWALMLALGSAFFLSIGIQDRSNWWAFIPGMTLLGVAGVVFLGEVAPRLGDRFGGSLVLGGIGLGFLLVYLADRRQWWAMIPFGVMATLAAFTGLEALIPGFDSPGIFFLGLGLTFALVAILPNEEGEMRWAWIPAGILLLAGVIVTAFTGDLLAYLWPVALIGVGLFLVARTILNR